MDRRGLLKSLLAAPAAAIVFNKTSEAEEKITYSKIDLDEPLGPPGKGIVACSGYYGELSDLRLMNDSGVIPRCSG